MPRKKIVEGSRVVVVLAFLQVIGDTTRHSSPRIRSRRRSSCCAVKTPLIGSQGPGVVIFLETVEYVLNG